MEYSWLLLLLLFAPLSQARFPEGPPPGSSQLRPQQLSNLSILSSSIVPTIQSLDVAGDDVLCLKHVVEISLIMKDPHAKQFLKAVQVFDSWGKVETGMLQGNVFWLGRSSECQDLAFDLSNSHVDVRFAIINFSVKGIAGEVWLGVCLPQTCHSEEIPILFNLISAKIKKDFDVNLDVDFNYLLLPEDGEEDFAFVLAVVIFAILATAVLVGTALETFMDYKAQRKAKIEAYGNLLDNIEHESFDVETPEESEEQNKVSNIIKTHSPMWVKCFLSFSLVNNATKVLSTQSAEGNIACLNGIRVLSMAWVILGHSLYFMAVTFPSVHIDNMGYLYSHYLHKWYFQPVFLTYCVDTFFVLSAFLLTYSLLPKLCHTGHFKKPMFWVAYVARRYIRLTPSLAFIMLFTVGIYKVLGNGAGPEWQPIRNDVHNCRETWWVNLIYGSNFVSSGRACIDWVWYLANDFQFYLISPFLLVLLAKKPRVGMFATSLLIVISIVTSFAISYSYNLLPGPTSSIMNVNVSQHYNSNMHLNFDELYVKPYCRFGAYGVGILLGYLLFSSPTFRMRRRFYFLGWMVSLAILAAVCFGMMGVTRGHYPSKFVVALYNSLSRPAWAVGVSWMIFACFHRRGGPINWFLSLDFWTPLSRLTYLAYLVHPLVLQYVYTTSGTKFHYTNLNFISLFISNFALSYFSAFVLVLLIESPIIGLEKAFLGR